MVKNNNLIWKVLILIIGAIVIFHIGWNCVSLFSQSNLSDIKINSYIKFNIPFNYSNIACPDFLPKEATCYQTTNENGSFIFYGTIENGDIKITWIPLSHFIDDSKNPTFGIPYSGVWQDKFEDSKNQSEVAHYEIPN